MVTVAFGAVCVLQALSFFFILRLSGGLFPGARWLLMQSLGAGVAFLNTVVVGVIFLHTVSW